MWDESGQATVESAVLFAALGLAIGLPMLAKLVEAWRAHEAAVRAVVELPLP